jgi:hypothetical protein
MNVHTTYRITAVLKVETDILTSMAAASPTGRVVILVIMSEFDIRLTDIFQLASYDLT